MWFTRIASIMAICFSSGCASKPTMYGAPSQKSKVPLAAVNPSGIYQDAKPSQVQNTINLISEQLLAPIGLRPVGIVLYETTGLINSEVVKPLDNFRRLQFGIYKFTLQANFKEDGSLFYLYIVINF